MNEDEKMKKLANKIAVFSIINNVLLIVGFFLSVLVIIALIRVSWYFAFIYKFV